MIFLVVIKQIWTIRQEYAHIQDLRTFKGQRVIIDSQNTVLYIDSSSQISVSGSSYAFKGSSMNSPADQAASMVGQGGYCGTAQNNPIYATFNMMNPNNVFDPNNYQVGSQGIIKPISDRQTAGGGYIYFNLEAINIQGNGITSQIEANGAPLTQNDSSTQDKMGGSGGYIHIITKNLIYNNSISQQSKIQSNGGNGILNGYGASGGVIILDGAFNLSNDQKVVIAYGGLAGSISQGLSPQGCGNGAAGTVWLKKLDTLFISNGNVITNKYTTLFAQNGQQYPNENSIAQNIIIDGGAFVNIQIWDQQQPNYNRMSSILFTNLFMEKNSRMQFDLGTNTDQLTIKYNNTFDVDKDSYINFENADQVYIQNNITDPSSPHTDNNDIQGLIQFIADELFIGDNVQLRAPQIFIYGNTSVQIGKGSQISSIKQFTCTTDMNANSDLFSCMSDDFDDLQLTQDQIIGSFNKQYTLQASSISQMSSTIMQKWNVYIMSAGNLTFLNSKVIAPRIGVCGDNISMINSKLDSNYKGCQHDSGLGNKPILKSPQCAGSGASHGGNGGSGGISSSDSASQLLCQNNYPTPYYFGKEARYEGSGGSSGDFAKTTGGSGGGIIWMKTPGTIFMNNSIVSVDGQSGFHKDSYQLGSGGGSGGSIQITTLNMMGNGNVSAIGGSGSIQGGGGGSGGRFIMRYLKPYLRESYPTQSYNWFGDFNIQGGKNGDIAFGYGQAQQGSNGTAFHSQCFPGYEGVFCRACDPGFFKQDYSYSTCIPCQNKPYFSKYVNRAINNSMCDYECNPLFESSKTNIDCLDPISLQVQRLGGVIPFFVFLGIFLLFSLIVFAMLSHRSQKINEELKDLPETLYMLWENDYNGPNFRGNTDANDFGMNDDCVWSHSHRMYLIGQNSISFPWFIPKDFPRDVLKKQDREKFVKFIDEYNPKLRYTFCEKLSFFILTILYPPLQDYFHLIIRKKKFQNLQTELYNYFPAQFWADKGDNKTIRLSCSQQDYFMAYIDFIDFNVNKQNWQGLRIPISILMAGNGTFNNPYNLDFQDDIFVKSLVLLKFDFFQDKLAIFLENFNSQLSKLSFFKLQFQIMSDMNNVVEWLEKANEALFYHFNVKCVLYVIENQYSDADGGVFKQKRRSFPLETIFFDAFPEMYIQLIGYLRERMITRKSEIRLAMIFKRHTKSKKIKTEMRVNMMKEQDQKNAYKQAINKQESVLFDETDRDVEEEIVRYDLKEEDRQNSQNSLDSSFSTFTSEFQPNGDVNAIGKKKGVKLVDKARRAFSISIESSKAFELAIRKPRKKCKHVLIRLRSMIYGIYLFLMKQQGSPPKSKNLNFFFMLYSGLLSLDIMILINYTLHLFLPYYNFFEFGWIFMFFVFLVPYTGPSLLFAASLKGSPYLMKVSSHMNSLSIMFNIPLVVIVSFYFDEDSIYFVLLALMIIVKMGLSASSAKVRQYLINPRFSKNAEKLKKILKRQSQKLIMREEILGKETIQQLEGIAVLNSSQDVMKNKDFGNQDSILSDNAMVQGQVINTNRLRDKLLE